MGLVRLSVKGASAACIKQLSALPLPLTGKVKRPLPFQMLARSIQILNLSRQLLHLCRRDIGHCPTGTCRDGVAARDSARSGGTCSSSRRGGRSDDLTAPVEVLADWLYDRGDTLLTIDQQHRTFVHSPWRPSISSSIGRIQDYPASCT